MSKGYGILAARALIAAIFLTSGLSKLASWSAVAGYMASKGMPAVPVLLAAAAAVEIIGGLSVLLGFRARMGAALLFLFLIPTTLIFHNFWALGGMERQMQLVSFFKNLAVMGGLLMVVSYGAGRLSLDALRTSASVRRDRRAGKLSGVEAR